MFREKIRPRDYTKLAERLTAKRFDAGAICDLAKDAGMKYVTFVAKHCDSFCLWDTKMTDFNSVKAPAGRDLVKEMARACNQRGLGFFVLL